MLKKRRKKLLIQDLEALYAKYDRRIMKLAEQAHFVRQQINALQQEKTKDGIQGDSLQSLPIREIGADVPISSTKSEGTGQDSSTI